MDGGIAQDQANDYHRDHLAGPIGNGDQNLSANTGTNFNQVVRAVTKIVVFSFRSNCTNEARGTSSSSPRLHLPHQFFRLLQWDESRRVSSADTGTTMLDRFAVSRVSHSAHQPHRYHLSNVL